MTNDTSIHLGRALTLAQRGTGFTSPNPRVGCVIASGATVLAEGWHARYGDVHAEAMALAALSVDPAEATMYVTLEPCNHWGKQPPCTEAIIKAGIRHVVVGMRDPNPRVSGKGADRLRDADILVEFAEPEVALSCRWLNRAWIIAVTESRPYIILKIATSLDGYMATLHKERREFTGSDTRAVVHALRAEADAVMVGMSTVQADNPRLDVRDVQGRTPACIVVGRSSSLPPHTFLAQQENREIHILSVDLESRTSAADFRQQLQVLHTEHAITTILCEGGPTLSSWLLANGFVDELRLHIAPTILGSGIRCRFTEEQWQLHDSRMVGSDVLHTYVSPETYRQVMGA